ncbi:MAG TPA: 23S rRNA (uracil(1939)-C(5))-methyltransferase RlmD [Burkholderiales bacterium]
MPRVTIESLDREGRGVARRDGKAVFVEGGLTGETVEYAVVRDKPTFEIGRVEAVLEPSAERVEPRCRFFGICGGCAMQHLDVRAQVAAKQRVLEDALWHIGRVRPETMLRAIYGEPWGYRHRARLSARFVPKKGGSLVGFHERKSSYVADMTSCEVLPGTISRLLPALRRLVDGLSIRERMPQIEVSIGDAATVLVFRVLEPPGPADGERLRAFADAHGVQVWLQPAGPESAARFWPEDAPALDYALADFDVRIGFLPTDFTQVNHGVNRILVRRAMALLDPRPGERIGDLFCGLGNFALPIARLGAAVTGFEGNAGLIERARANARANGLEAEFRAIDLFDAAACAELPAFDKALLDPPRDGAIELVKSFAARPPRRIVYVSCDPATLARDAGVLVQAQGYRFAAAGAVNMFPHPAHVESLALFERD